MAGGVDPERAEDEDLHSKRPLLHGARAVQPEASKLGAAEVAVEVASCEVRQIGVSNDHAGDDAAGAFAQREADSGAGASSRHPRRGAFRLDGRNRGTRELESRRHEVLAASGSQGRGVRRERLVSLQAGPPEVETRARGDVDLFDPHLAHVSDDECPRFRVEAEPPRVAEPVDPDLVSSGATDERIVPGDAIWEPPPAEVDPQDLAVQVVDALGAERQIVEDPTVPLADVEEPVGTEEEESPVVSVGWVRDHEDASRGRDVGDVRVLRTSELLDDRRMLAIRVVDVEDARGRVVGSEREREQALLEALGRDTIRDVEEGTREPARSVQYPDPPGFLDDEEPCVAWW
jgi:hypothetical protein